MRPKGMTTRCTARRFVGQGGGQQPALPPSSLAMYRQLGIRRRTRSRRDSSDRRCHSCQHQPFEPSAASFASWQLKRSRPRHSAPARVELDAGTAGRGHADRNGAER
ncbi:hypothetical protein RJ55_05550 [Drechmeria coniospora]|nr:hypothetical protein RJ55_05550 [Drechmeria coniospora]